MHLDSVVTDKVEIQELTARYALAMDEHDVERWLKTWAPDGKWEGALGTYVGFQGLPRLLRDLGERIVGKRHVITNHIIDIEGSEAQQTCYMQIWAVKGGSRVVGTAIYRDRLRKSDGQWQFVHRRLQLDT